MHDHPHPGHGDLKARSQRRLSWTLGLVLVYLVAEVAGGLLTGSLALLADAGHMLSDAGALGLALFALRMARRPRTPEKTYGYHRTEILAALANGVTLVAVAVLVVREALERFADPRPVDGPWMTAIAVGGLVVNLVGVAILASGRHESLNVRGAWLHVLSDALGSVQAIVAGALVWAYGWTWADPLASVLIALLVVASAWHLLRDAVNVLMEGTPRHISAPDVRLALERVPGVEEIHDLHIWTITSGFESLSVHARVAGRDRDEVLRDLGRVVRDRFHIAHSTVQIEGEDGCGHDPCD